MPGSPMRSSLRLSQLLGAHGIDWRDVDPGEAKCLVAAYRDYCLVTCELAPNTTR
ncbi:hypothetical protein ALQ64_05529 [Pseudomonas cannabina]|uniref:Uncharacterized protein n=1 Tax=Pseudomonas cannabina TaxID=86840 RepID=A0A0N8QWE4_PSECA|nr:hypothetical protein ALO81_04750 [Pseudomonas cannabina]RMN24974.1 hypothetical protein ALQ64_05529 [Pseudomonas cannabina]